MPLYGSAVSGYYQGLDEAAQRARYQQLIDQQNQQNQGLSAWANTIAQPPPAPPLPPPPGAQSQPMPPQGQGAPQPPQGMPPQQRPPMMPPGQMPGRQMGPPPQQMGPPPQQQQPPQLPPYTSPKAPPQQPPQQAPQSLQPPPQGQDPSQGLPPPPPQVTAAIQSALPNLHDMASKLQEQGITGMPLYYALMQHKEMLSQEGKQQLAELNLMLRKEQADNSELRARATQQGANTKDRQEDLRERSADGGTATSAARIKLMDAQTVSALARAKKAASSGGSVDASDVDLIAQGLVDGRINPSSLSVKGGLREKAIEKALKIDPKYDMKNYNAENALDVSASRAAGTAGANAAIASDAAQGGADILMEEAAKVPRTAITSINKMWNASRGEFQDAKYGGFAAALNTFVNEYARAVNPKGTATVSDKEHAREILSAADSQENLEEKMGVLRKEMDRAKKAPRDVAADLRKDRKDAAGDGMSDQDKQALAWAKANPNDPRAKQIKQRLGM